MQISQALAEALRDVKEKIKEKKKRILVQIPEGLKQYALEIEDSLKEVAEEVFVCIDPCFGACDVAEDKAKKIGAELILHFGHNQFYKPSVPTVFVPLKFNVEESLVLELVERLKSENIGKVGLCCNVQHVEEIANIAKILERNGIEVFVGENKNGILAQVLGCDFSAAKVIAEDVDAIVFIGDGLFHSLGIIFATGKRVVQLDTLNKKISKIGIQKDAFLRQRFAAIEFFKKAKKVGIIVSTKKGQFRLEKAIELKKKIEKAGKETALLIGDFLFPEYFVGINVDCFVNTACPRIAIDDYANFKVPILNPAEVDIALGYRKLAHYEF